MSYVVGQIMLGLMSWIYESISKTNAQLNNPRIIYQYFLHKEYATSRSKHWKIAMAFSYKLPLATAR